MKINTTNPTAALSRWARFSRMILGFVVPVSAGLTAALLVGVFMGGCKEEDPGIVNACIAPTVTRTSPANGDTNVSFNKPGGAMGGTGVGAVRIITATFSTPMNPNSITTATFTVRQGTNSISGSVLYSDTTAVFIAPNGLGPNLTYTCTITTGVRDKTGTALASNYVWTFTTIALGAPTLISPVNGAVNQAPNPLMVWNGVPAASTYRLQVSLSPGFVGTVYDDSTITSSSQPISGLAVGTSYYWRVNAKVSGGTGPYSATWRFTVAATLPPTVNLGTAARFGAMGGNAGITNQGTLTQVLGNLGTTAASTLITGFHDGTSPPTNVFTETPLNIGAVRDTIYTATAPPGSVPGAVAALGLADADSAFNYLAGLPPGPDPGAGELGGLTLAPGTYTSASGSFAITLVDLTLDGQGDPNARFVFQIGSSLTVGAAGPSGARSVILINGAQPKNVFWQVGSAATINGAGGGTMAGTIIASSGVTFSTAGNTTITRLEGRALSLVASVTMVNTIINVPLP